MYTFISNSGFVTVQCTKRIKLSNVILFFDSTVHIKLNSRIDDTGNHLCPIITQEITTEMASIPNMAFQCLSSAYLWNYHFFAILMYISSTASTWGFQRLRNEDEFGNVKTYQSKLLTKHEQNIQIHIYIYADTHITIQSCGRLINQKFIYLYLIFIFLWSPRLHLFDQKKQYYH